MPSALLFYGKRYSPALKTASVTGKSSRCLSYVIDHQTNARYLIDTDPEMCLFPPPYV